jgi:hypothetical protein
MKKLLIALISAGLLAAAPAQAMIPNDSGWKHPAKHHAKHHPKHHRR